MKLENIISSIEFYCQDAPGYPGFSRVIQLSDAIVDGDMIRFDVEVPLYLEDYMLTIILDQEDYEEDYLDVELIDGILKERITVKILEIEESGKSIDYELDIQFLEASVDSCTDTTYPLNVVEEAINRDIEDYDLEPSEEFEYEYYAVNFNLIKDAENK